jgi:hypothetical protein
MPPPQSRVLEVDKRAGGAIVWKKLPQGPKIGSTGYPGSSR